MFHTYVTASSGRQIDFDRARLLMDEAILAWAEQMWRDTFRRLQKTPVRGPGHVEHPDIRVLGGLESIARGVLKVPSRPQDVWEWYCHRHAVEYGEPFEPDVSLTWDT